jgi:cytochrome P450
MFTAGTDTAYLALEFAMAELMLHQYALAKLQAEARKTMPDGQETINEGNLAGMTYLKAVIKETLRLHPPSPLLVPHLSLEDCDVDNYMVPAGTTVFINAWAIGRDPRMWNAPEEFMPERFIDSKGDITGADFRGNDFQFLPFGSGRRICPGVNFALASVEIMLGNLVYHFDWELPEGVHNVDMTEVFTLTVRWKEKLLLIPRFHPPSTQEE